VVVDIGGGNGQFLTELLTKHPKLHGVVVDFKGQVTRGQAVSAALRSLSASRLGPWGLADAHLIGTHMRACA
jgi:tRNA G46 methylase TrmB